MCVLHLDEMRSEYGRDRGDGITDAEIRATRKRLVDGIAVQLDHAGPLTDPTPAPDEEAAQHELLAALACAVDSLEPREQLLLSLRFHDDFSAREIAQLLEMPTPFHAFRAIDKVLAKLRQALGKKGFTDGDD